VRRRAVAALVGEPCAAEGPGGRFGEADRRIGV